MPRPLLALLLAGALPAVADDRAPAAAAVSYGARADLAAPAFEPRRRVQQAAVDEAAPAVVVVRGIAGDGPVPAMSGAPEVEAIRAIAALCRVDPTGMVAASLPARF